MYIYDFPGLSAKRLPFLKVWDQGPIGWGQRNIPYAYDGKLDTKYDVAWADFSFLAFHLGNDTFVSGIQIKFAGGGKKNFTDFAALYDDLYH